MKRQSTRTAAERTRNILHSARHRSATGGFGSRRTVLSAHKQAGRENHERTSQAPIAGKGPLSPELLRKLDAYWRAANYLSVGQIYLLDNPLLKKSLKHEHIKPRLLGHWGTTPGLNFIYVHLNRIIKERDLNMIYVTGPGHGGPGIVANTYLEGTYSELYPNVSQDEAGLKRLFTQFSFPGGIPSHAAPETPVPLTKAVNSVIRWLTPSAPSSIIPISLPPAWSVMARPRPAPWPPLGTPTNS